MGERSILQCVVVLTTVLMGVAIRPLNTAGSPLFHTKVDYAVGEFPKSVTIKDLNADGHPDLAVANWNTDSVSILLGSGDGTFQPAMHYQGLYCPVSVAIDDLNADGHPDLAVANYCHYYVSVLLGNGNGTFQTPVHYWLGSGYQFGSLAIGDLNGDGYPDLVGTVSYYHTVGVLLGNGDGTFQTIVNYEVGRLGPCSVAIGDLNGDEHPDLAVADSSGDAVSVLLGNGDGTYQAAVIYWVGRAPLSVAIGDLNGDGRADLAVANESSRDVSVLLGNGDGTFQTGVNYGLGNILPWSVAIGDLNGDGHLDLATGNYWEDFGNYSTTASVLLGNGNGTFQTAVNYVVGTSPQSVAIGDLNGDGHLDLTTANAVDDTVSVLINAAPGNCFIATAVFGTAEACKINALRAFRDSYLSGRPIGKAIVTGYYKYSPPVANYIAQRAWLKVVVQMLLTPVIGFISLFI